LLAEDRINVGRLHLEGRRAGARIGELVDAALARTGRPAPAAPPPPPPPPPGAPGGGPSHARARGVTSAG
ncbi:hypothetical protein ACFV0W_01625, partial [Streptomyces anulatus]